MFFFWLLVKMTRYKQQYSSNLRRAVRKIKWTLHFLKLPQKFEKLFRQNYLRSSTKLFHVIQCQIISTTTILKAYFSFNPQILMYAFIKCLPRQIGIHGLFSIFGDLLRKQSNQIQCNCVHEKRLLCY